MHLFYPLTILSMFLHTQWKRNKAKSTLWKLNSLAFFSIFLWNLDVLAGSYHMFVSKPKAILKVKSRCSEGFWSNTYEFSDVLKGKIPMFIHEIPINAKVLCHILLVLLVHTGPTSFSWSAECLKLLSAAVNGFFLCCAQFWNGTIYHKWRF